MRNGLRKITSECITKAQTFIVSPSPYRRLQVGSGLSLRPLSRAPARFVSSKLRPAMRAASEAVAEQTIREVLQSSRSYVTGLWARLNGQRVSAASESLPLGMRTPAAKGGALAARGSH